MAIEPKPKLRQGVAEPSESIKRHYIARSVYMGGDETFNLPRGWQSNRGVSKCGNNIENVTSDSLSATAGQVAKSRQLIPVRFRGRRL